jgi:hypothetical protein
VVMTMADRGDLDMSNESEKGRGIEGTRESKQKAAKSCAVCGEKKAPVLPSAREMVGCRRKEQARHLRACERTDSRSSVTFLSSSKEQWKDNGLAGNEGCGIYSRGGESQDAI